jgi:hypothetical protein
LKGDVVVATARTNTEEMIMKTILSVLLALSVLAGIAAPASAFDSKTFWEQQDRSHY